MSTALPPEDLPTESIAPRDGAGSAPPAPSSSPRGAGERQGDVIGPFTLLERIGEGGFGAVWLAERREPMVQRVALKIIKPGMDSAAVVARFEQERQALAVMDHPNVARVFDGGVTPTGRPYFVMEYVQGEPITSFADRRRLTLRQRLELFIPVCDAVQHAHHKGLIHRDIKPSNVLVAEVEGRPAPKVIDFGVAKAIARSDWDHTAQTELGMVIGTPEYMSPEQIAGEIDIDTRTDVYSLGVLLYELLTGEQPFDSRELRKAALAEVQRIIREITPPKPSTRLLQLVGERTTTVAQARSTSSDRIASELRRELDWIPLMALRKERERRYDSPQAMADDIQRYLDGRPLQAAPESRAYLAKKFIRRNKLQVVAVSAVMLALTAGLTLSLWQRNEAIEAQRAAERAEAAASAARDAERERADQLKKVSDFQAQMLGQIDTTQAGVDLMADVRERFVAALEKAGIPEAERSARLDALRRDLVRLNATDAAAAMIDRTILRPAIKAIDEQFQNDPATDASLRQALADLYQKIGLHDAAYPLQKSALATRRHMLGEEHPSTLSSINNMGILLVYQGKNDEAEPYVREALEKRRRVLGDEHPDTLASLSNMAFLLEAQRKLADAEPYVREALEKRRRVLGDEHPGTLISINFMGSVLQAQGKLVEAEPYCREAMEKSRRVLGEEHPNTLAFIGSMGVLLHDQGRLAEAEPYYLEALEKSRRVLGEEHPDTLIYISNMGVLFQDQGNLDQAELYYREALNVQRRLLGDDHGDTLISVNNLALLLADLGKGEEALKLADEAVESGRRVLGKAHWLVGNFLGKRGRALEVLGRYEEAAAAMKEGHAILVDAIGAEHLQTERVVGYLADLYDRWHEAEPGKGYDANAAEWRAQAAR